MRLVISILFVSALALFPYATGRAQDELLGEIRSVGSEFDGTLEGDTLLDDPFDELRELERNLEQELEWLQAESYVITASKVPEDIKKSAASISVVTDREIRRMGARELKDVLRSLPGFSFQNERHGSYDLEIRGVLRDADQNVLFLLNNNSLNTNYWGGIGPSYLPLTLENIKRIEVVRGPGSALYGANAFSAVVNIITKEPEELEGFELTAKGGSYATQQYNLLLGKSYGELGIGLNANYFDSDTFRGYIEQDVQTELDQRLGSQASLAPGDTNGSDRKYDLSVILQYKNFRFDGVYAKRDRVPSIGIAPILNIGSETPSTDYAMNLTYVKDLNKGLTLQGRAYHNYTYMDYYYQIYPENAVLPTPTGPQIWPEGMIGAPSNKNTRTGAELQATYAFNEANTIVAGATYEYMNQYDVKALSNYFATPVKDVAIPREDVSEVSHIQNYNREVDRTFAALFLEDLWDLRKDLRLTLGARYDNYSDFGDSFNPRAGLVWEFLAGYDLKLLYGRAFRAPSFYELYNENNPAFVGNPDLRPETVDTYELSAGAQITPTLDIRLTAFRNLIHDSIELATYETQDVFENQGDIRTQGIEAEFTYEFGKGNHLAANYTYQDAQNLEADEALYKVPEHKGNLMANLRVSKYINLYGEYYFQEGFSRQKDDPRNDDNPGFGVCNATLIVRKFLPQPDTLEVRASVYNLLDEGYTVPTDKDGLPVDYPMPGRHFLVELQYTF